MTTFNIEKRATNGSWRIVATGVNRRQALSYLRSVANPESTYNEAYMTAEGVSRVTGSPVGDMAITYDYRAVEVKK